jgi:hypothetical protein
VSERPAWLRADLLVAMAIVVAIAVALLSPRWRTGARGATGGIGSAGASEDVAAGANPLRRPTLDQPNLRPGEVDPSKLERHRSPFDDAVTARAESLCVRMAESQLGFALKEPVTIDVQDHYGTGNEDDGRGVYLIFEGLAKTPSSRVSVFRCTAKSYGAYPGTPVITHVEPR